MSSSKAGPATARFRAPLRAEVEAHGSRDYPAEACGLLLGRRVGNAVEIFAVLAAENESEGEREQRYLVNTEDYRAAEKEATHRGLEVVGVYHSHPDSPPVPSSVDDEFAFPEWIYWITEVRNGTPAQNRLWYRNADLETWTELDQGDLPD